MVGSDVESSLHFRGRAQLEARAMPCPPADVGRGGARGCLCGIPVACVALARVDGALACVALACVACACVA
jgi:hypothetical protein